MTLAELFDVAIRAVDAEAAEQLLSIAQGQSGPFVWPDSSIYDPESHTTYYTMSDYLAAALPNLPALSLHRPWAFWVAANLKRIETRSHNRFRGLSGQRIAVHAAQQWDDSAFRIAAPYLDPTLLAQEHELRRSTGGLILCTALVADARLLTPDDSAAALIECRTPRYGLVLTDIVPLPVPIPARGKQGIWRLR